MIGQSDINCNASTHDVPMLRYCSVLGKMFYIKGKVHENFMYHADAGQLGKGNLMAMCPVHFLNSQYLRKFLFYQCIGEISLLLVK